MLTEGTTQSSPGIILIDDPRDYKAVVCSPGHANKQCDHDK